MTGRAEAMRAEHGHGLRILRQMPTPKRTRPSQPRAVATRAAIVRGAAKAFVRLGYAAASLTAIGKETRISNGALYFHFETREAVAVAVLEEYQAIVREMVAAETARGRSALESLIGISFSFTKLIQRNVVVQAGLVLSTERSNLPTSASKQAYDTWITQITLAVTLGQRQGDVRNDVDARQLGELLSAAFTGIQMMSAAISNHRDLVERVRTSWLLLLPSVVPADRLAATQDILAQTTATA